MEEEKILNVTQLGVVDKLQNEDVILLIRNTDNGKQCFQIKGFDFRGESAYEAALSQGFEGTYSEWVQQIKEVTEYDTKTLLSFNGIAVNDANSALRSGIYPSVTTNVPMNGETFTIQTLRTTTAVYNQYVSTQIAIGVTGAAIGKVYIRKNTQKSGAYTFGDWIDLTADTNITDAVYKYVAQQVTDGTWIPVKAGRFKGEIVDGAVAEGLNTKAIHQCSHAEGKNTEAAGYCSHAEGENTKTGGSGAHAEGKNTLANGVGSHAEGKGVEVSCWYGHGEGAYNYEPGHFIRTLGVGNSESNRVNAEAVYVKKSSDGNSLPIPSDPKNGYKYLLGIGGYTGKDITEGMKSIQEVISDLLSRIAILEAKSKPKTSYIIGKAIPIGKLNGGARLNAYAVNGYLRFKLSRVPQLGRIICRDHTGSEVDALLENVTWHVFIDGNERKISLPSTECNGDILRTSVKLNGFYMLDNTANNSGDLSSDMYIYLKTVFEGVLEDVKCTSETLRYYDGYRIWEPFIHLPYISGKFYIDGFDGSNIRLQRLHTRQRRSVYSGKDRSLFSYTNYRGSFEQRLIKRYGVYRYRIVKDGKKTQWHTINIMRADYDRKRFIIK